VVWWCVTQIRSAAQQSTAHCFAARPVRLRQTGSLAHSAATAVLLQMPVPCSSSGGIQAPCPRRSLEGGDEDWARTERPASHSEGPKSKVEDGMRRTESLPCGSAAPSYASLPASTAAAFCTDALAARQRGWRRKGQRRGRPARRSPPPAEPAQRPSGGRHESRRMVLGIGGGLVMGSSGGEAVGGGSEAAVPGSDSEAQRARARRAGWGRGGIGGSGLGGGGRGLGLRGGLGVGGECGLGGSGSGRLGNCGHRLRGSRLSQAWRKRCSRAWRRQRGLGGGGGLWLGGRCELELGGAEGLGSVKVAGWGWAEAERAAARAPREAVA